MILKNLKHNYLTIRVILFCCVSFISNLVLAQFCPDGGFEQGHLANFTCYWSDLYIGGPNNGTYGPYNSGCVPITNHSIVNAGATIYGMNYGVEGTKALKLGDNNNAQLSRIDYTFTAVTSDLKFYYNAILEEPFHLPADQAYFEYIISSTTSGIIDQKRIVTGNSPLLQRVGGPDYTPIYSTKWICYSLDLSAYIGEQITVSFRVADCLGGGHYGYAFIDGLCTGSSPISSDIVLDTTFCNDQTIVADGSGSKYEQSYKWTVTPVDNLGNPISSSIFSNHPNSEVTNFDIKSFYKNKTGNEIPCNNYYQIDLEVTNACGDTDQKSQQIYIECIPEVNAGNNICINDINDLYVGVSIGDPSFTPTPGATYSWYPPVYLSNPNSPQTIFRLPNGVPPQFPYKVTLIADAPNGCRTMDSMYIVTQPQFDIVERREDCCGATLSVSSRSNETFQYLWSTGETSSEIVVKNSGTYSVTVDNGCANDTKSITVNNLNTERYWRTVNEIESSEIYIASSTNINNSQSFYIAHKEFNRPNYGRYSATQYRLTIFNRWGTNNTCH